MVIRGIKKEDFDYIVSVLDRWWGGPSGERAHPVFFYELGEQALIAELDGEVVGFLLGFLAPTDPPTAYVHLVGIHPEHRRRGVGKELYEQFTRRAQGAGARRIKAITTVGNEGSNPLPRGARLRRPGGAGLRRARTFARRVHQGSIEAPARCRSARSSRMSSYSGAEKAKEAREALGKALAALQEDPNIPSDVLAVAQNIAQSVGALFEAERASSEPDGKSCVKNALGSLSQTMALLQDVRGEHVGIQTATETIARAMSALFPLTTAPTRPPAAGEEPAPMPLVPKAAPVPQAEPKQSSPYRDEIPREHVEANLGATTESNFYVGFSGEISQGGVFISTYNILPKGTPVRVLITLPGNLSTEVNGDVRFVRDPMDMSADSEPGMGIAFEGLQKDSRELILRFIRKRAPMFYDD